MYRTAQTLDDLLRAVFEPLLSSKDIIEATRGRFTELRGVVLRLTNPRARLSHSDRKGKVFSGLGELFWYLAKTDDAEQIVYYLDEYQKDAVGGRINGAYGPRIFNMRGKHDQFANVLDLLKRKETSRQAVIQLLNAEDIAEKHAEIPCTCSFQFMIRHSRLEMITYMRSNDAFWGLPHDVFAFTMIQEIMARNLGIELGPYTHMVGSLHLYEETFEAARQYVKEGLQPTINVAMPPMPLGDPQPSIDAVVKAEAATRAGKELEANNLGLDPYWADLVRLLQIYGNSKNGSNKIIQSLQVKMSSGVYNQYISKAEKRSSKKR